MNTSELRPFLMYSLSLGFVVPFELSFDMQHPLSSVQIERDFLRVSRQGCFF